MVEIEVFRSILFGLAVCVGALVMLAAVYVVVSRVIESYIIR